jgi:hypothetical protein
MTTKEIILKAIANINEALNIQELQCVDEKTQIFELLDSLGTLDLILELESILEEGTGEYIAIANEHSMDYNKTPFRDLNTLEKYIDQRITNA